MFNTLKIKIVVTLNYIYKYFKDHKKFFILHFTNTNNFIIKMVEMSGVEPLTLRLQSGCSTS